MWLINVVAALVILPGIIMEFMIPEENQNQLRLFINTVFFGLNVFFAYKQLF